MAKENDLKIAEEVSKNLRIRDIHLAESNCWRDLSFKPKQAHVDINIEIKSLNSTNKGVLPFSCRFRLIGMDTDKDKESFNLNITFIAVYNKEDNYKPTKKQKDAFGLTNAIFNVWPYVREHVQSTMIKMNLTAFVLPPITINGLSKMVKSDG
ncbi:MAG: hypothetical protein ACLFUL_12965 [Desulfobacteraceae bacterium]